MNPHLWISAVLDDIVAYADRNDLPQVREELARSAGRIARLLDDHRPVPGREPACDVIRIAPQRA